MTSVFGYKNPLLNAHVILFDESQQTLYKRSSFYQSNLILNNFLYSYTVVPCIENNFLILKNFKSYILKNKLYLCDVYHKN